MVENDNILHALLDFKSLGSFSSMGKCYEIKDITIMLTLCCSNSVYFMFLDVQCILVHVMYNAFYH